ncbi:TetR family transcriptional regulator [Marinomonas agarivorans]|nr:TetR family transcriptional regulator [Marinomonas agarivorans]
MEQKRTKDQLKAHIREKNQQIILTAAEKVFAQHGLTKATTKMIADEAGLPKANIHYYYRSKQDLLEAVLKHIMGLWLSSITRFSIEDGPKVSLTRYIAEKMQQSRENTDASKIFALSLISEEPFLLTFLQEHFIKEMEREKQIIQTWINEGKMQVLSIEHLFISIWALTQTYADFDAQVKLMLQKTELDEKDHAMSKQFITHMVLSSCGITEA